MSSSGTSVSSGSDTEASPPSHTSTLERSRLARIRSEHGTAASGNSRPRTLAPPRLQRRESGDQRARTSESGGIRPSMVIGEFGSSMRRNLSSGHQLERATWSEFLREGPSPRDDLDPVRDARRISIMAADRKRRLTASAQDSGRRRTTSGGFHNRHGSSASAQLDGPSSPRRSAWPRRTDSINNPQPAYLDLTSPSPEAPRSALPARPAVRRARRYVQPRWQPDAEAAECPICKRPFTFYFRRHHCRKCGRVVCNECSPHRITIPRQSIVHPPDPNQPSTTVRQSSSDHIETIDLTDDANVERALAGQRTSSSSNPILWGGEKVRLCNPCVPDPQPSPLLNPSDAAPSRPSQTASSRFDPGSLTDSPEVSAFLRRYGIRMGGGSQRTDLANSAAPNTSQPNRPPSYSISTGPTHPNSRGPMFMYRPVPIAGPPQGHPPPYQSGPPTAPSNVHGHARHQSLDPASRPDASLYSHSRFRAMFDGDPNMRRAVDQASSSASSRPSIEHRIRLHERDICPICHRALPALGTEGDESAREAHIVACLASRDQASVQAASLWSEAMGGFLPPQRLHVLPFVASEKDCLAEDGNAHECSICMDEYNVGDQLARLECLCKFHKHCIEDWLGRKQECPVHKIT